MTFPSSSSSSSSSFQPRMGDGSASASGYGQFFNLPSQLPHESGLGILPRNEQPLLPTPSMHPYSSINHGTSFMHNQTACWTPSENKVFEIALAQVGENDPLRWEKIAAWVPGKTMEQVKEHYLCLLEDIERIHLGLVPIPCYVDDPLSVKMVQREEKQKKKNNGKQAAEKMKKKEQAAEKKEEAVEKMKKKEQAAEKKEEAVEKMKKKEEAAEKMKKKEEEAEKMKKKEEAAEKMKTKEEEAEKMKKKEEATEKMKKKEKTAATSKKKSGERRKSVPWTEEEHGCVLQFLWLFV